MTHENETIKKTQAIRLFNEPFLEITQQNHPKMVTFWLACNAILNSRRRIWLFPSLMPSFTNFPNNPQRVYQSSEPEYWPSLCMLLIALAERLGDRIIEDKDYAPNALVEKPSSLFHFFTSTCAPSLTIIPPHCQIQNLPTKSQYLVHFPNQHKEEKAFAERCNQNGSFFAFHGSPIENWHSMLRTGILSFSGDKEKMQNGNNHGNGIYISQYADHATVYSRTSMPKQYKNFIGLVVCEVVGSPEEYAVAYGGARTHYSVLVVPNVLDIRIRIFTLIDVSKSMYRKNNITYLPKQILANDYLFVAQCIEAIDPKTGKWADKCLTVPASFQ